MDRPIQSVSRHLTVIRGARNIIFVRLEGPVSAEEGGEISRLHCEFGDTHDHVFS